MEKQILDKSLKLVLSILILLGTILIGIGIGLIICKVLEVFLISFGVGLIVVALLLMLIEFDKY